MDIKEHQQIWSISFFDKKIGSLSMIQMLGQEIILIISNLGIVSFGATSIVKYRDKEKYVYRGQGITFDSAGSQSFDCDTAENVIIPGVDNSSSTHSDYCNNNFLLLSEGPTLEINRSFASPEKKANTKCCLSLHYNAGNSYLFVNGKINFQI